MEIQPTQAISWKQVAVQRQEMLRTGAEGEIIREAVETVIPVLYTQRGTEIQVQQLAASRRGDISV